MEGGTDTLYRLYPTHPEIALGCSDDGRQDQIVSPAVGAVGPKLSPR